ncbi:MAG: toxin [Saprospiraceae bacterium]
MPANKDAFAKYNTAKNFHDFLKANHEANINIPHWDTKFTYTFFNFSHPFVGELISKLNQDSLSGMLDPNWLEELSQHFFKDLYNPADNKLVHVDYFPKEIDTDRGPYSNYNWELFFHAPLAIAVHLSKTQRFAEAQRWFHFIFDPTSNDQSVEKVKRFWKFIAFRTEKGERIEEIVRILSTPKASLSVEEQALQDKYMNGYTGILNKPFQPHVIARTRKLAYQYNVVMKYLDNLIAWGDQLFQQDTVESINEATQLYVLAANILGERPQRIPQVGKVKAKSFAQLKKEGLGPIGNALVELEGQFPFNFAIPNQGPGGDNAGSSNALFGIGRTLYFCIPPNEKMLGYWDTVADRLFKIRHCMNMAGVVRPLALFDPPIDPGMLVKAAAAGIDISSIVNGMHQPIGPIRSLAIIQKALELCSEVRGLGNSLLSAIEKGEAEHLALVRQRHEVQIQQMTQEVRFLQWAQTQETTQSLLTSRKAALERLNYYRRLLGLPNDNNAWDMDNLTRTELNEDNFSQNYSKLVTQYTQKITLQNLPNLQIAADSTSNGLADPFGLFNGSPSGGLYLDTKEDAELNSHLPRARDTALLSSTFNALAAGFAVLPKEVQARFHFWGLGASSDVPVGRALVATAKIAGDVLGIMAGWEREQAGMASRTASYQRRADEWILQYNLAAHELMQNGRQILTSLIAEQIAYREYLNIQQQIKNSQEVDQFLHDKFTNEDLYLWMQGEISRLYYEYYRFAFDTARKAERTMKQELMRPEVDAQEFVKFNYWDGGRKGLLSGEALFLDVKRMEMAYHENNKREIELVKHISLRQLNPIALLALKATGTCQVTIPEWLYDLDCPGHYMRRIKNIALSLPCIAGPYTSVNCTLSMLKSSLRKSSIAGEDYARQDSEDERFIDYVGAVQSIVTSSGQNDSGMFETNLRDERFLPFEGAGAESTWKLDLPKDYRSFDYNTISDVILHIRYTARQGVEISKVKSAIDSLFEETTNTNLALLFSLQYDFPSEWSAFVNRPGNFIAKIPRDFFPYFSQGKEITITGYELYGEDSNNTSLRHHVLGGKAVWDNVTDDPKSNHALTVNIAPDEPGPTQLMTKTAKEVFLVIRYKVS